MSLETNADACRKENGINTAGVRTLLPSNSHKIQLFNMDDLNHFTEGGVKNLPLLPSQSSHIPAGRYVIKCDKEDSVAASDASVQAKIWFKSPASHLLPPSTNNLLIDTAYRVCVASQDPRGKAFC